MTVRGLQAERNQIRLPSARAKKEMNEEKNKQKTKTPKLQGVLAGMAAEGMDMTDLVRGWKLEATDFPQYHIHHMYSPHVYQRKSEKKKIRLRNKFPYCQHAHI